MALECRLESKFRNTCLVIVGLHTFPCEFESSMTSSPYIVLLKLVCLVVAPVQYRVRLLVAIMFALYKQSEGFVKNEINMFGAEGETVKRSIRARIKHIRDVMPSMPRELEDSQNLMRELVKESEVFTHADRLEIGQVLSDHMAGRQPQTGAAGGTKLQTNIYLHKYMPDTLWKTLQDPKVDWDDKKEASIDFLLTIRCVNPDDATYKNLLAILQDCSSKKFSDPTEAYSEIKSLKTKMVNKRPFSNAVQALPVYPADASEFMRQFGNIYSQCDPPVASKIADEKLRQLTRKDRMPTRSTNGAIDDDGRRPSKPNKSQADPNADFFRMMCGYMVANQQGSFSLESSPMNERPRRQPSTRAIEDGVVDPLREPSKMAALALTNGPPAGGPSDAMNVLQKARDAMLKRKGAATAAKATKAKGGQGRGQGKKGNDKKRPIDEVSSDNDEEAGQEEEEDEDEEEEQEEEEEVEEDGDETPSAIKRPAANMKKPAAVDSKKKPAAAVSASGGDGGDGGNPKPSTSPTAYNGGRIHFRASANSFRVYTRTADKVEKTVSGANPAIESDFKKAWKLALRFIDEDPRPR
jgi:hypothetical protein